MVAPQHRIGDGTSWSRRQRANLDHSHLQTACSFRRLEAAAQGRKPTVVVFLGADMAGARAAGLIPAATLEDAARLALEADWGIPPEHIFGRPHWARLREAGNKSSGRRFVCVLYSGGTLCREAILVLERSLGPIRHPAASGPLSAAHTCLDLGGEEFTLGRPHPMIDARLRTEKMAAAARDPHTGGFTI